MKITNKMDLPEALVKAIENDDYDPGESDITVTQLLDPPRLVALKRKYKDKIEVDASDMIFALDGKAMHSVLETSGMGLKDTIQEERLYADMVGWRLGGKFDSLVLTRREPDIWRLEDFKRTSGYVLKPKKDGEESRMDTWGFQLNIYRWLIWKNLECNVDEMRLVCMIRDWSKLKAKREPDFPQTQVQIREVGAMTMPAISALVEQKIHFHQEAQQALDTGGQDDPAFPECSSKDIWEKPTAYAVIKEGRKSALRLLFKPEDADKWMMDNKHGSVQHCVTGELTHSGDPGTYVQPNKGIYVDVRIGERVRCENYCDVAEFCKQFKEWKETQNAEG